MGRVWGFGRLVLLFAAASSPAVHSLARTPKAAAAPVEAGVPGRQGSPADAELVDLRVGEHRFRIPRACFRHPPYPSGVDTGFYVRAL